MCAGNLVDMGGLAFAPASESVLRFTDHLMRTHALFKGAFSGVFPSEAEAEARGNFGIRVFKGSLNPTPFFRMGLSPLPGACGHAVVLQRHAAGCFVCCGQVHAV